MFDKTLRFVSWNVRGVNKLTKACRVLHHLNDLKCDIAFLQETHLSNSDVARLKRSWVEHVFHSKFSGRSRGAAILIRRNVPFDLDQCIADSTGRFVAVSGTLGGQPVVIVSVYAPTWDDD